MNARPPAGAVLWTATIGNTLLAIPAPVGLVFAVTVGGVEGVLGTGDTGLMVLMGGAILLGLVLVGGYWWATLRGGPGTGPWPRVFWGFSALYNVVASGFWVTQLTDELGGINPSTLLVLAWTLFMAGLSLYRLRVHAVDPPAPPPLPEPASI
ncbi:MAG TPA: hypothetical protein VK610_01420 [Rhodothermales bacterium]|nr:hypothetical protein [Rhodothermales bacterium]